MIWNPIRIFSESFSRNTALVALAAILPLSALALSTPPRRKPFRIVIDPGHGGTDYGTVYAQGRLRIAEKNVTLLIAKEVAKKLRARGYSVLLTRDSDDDVGLAARTALANKMGADVFLSIHMNSTSTPMVAGTEGIETYILNNATDASSKRLAHLENSVISPTVVVDTPQQMDVALILKDLRLDANLAESKRLACAIQENLVSIAPARRQRNRGVKQALFHVLLGADMPSVLVEAGFLTSPRDRALVLSPRGRESMSQAISRAIEQFRRSKDRPETLSAVSRCKIN